MGMNVGVELAELVGALPHLAGLSIDKTEEGEDVVTVTRNEHRAVGDLYEGMCLSLGRPQGLSLRYAWP